MSIDTIEITYTPTPIVFPQKDDPKAMRSSLAVGRLVAFLALSLVVAAAAFVVHEGRSALTDAWVSPMSLSPDNDKVVALRIQQTKERAERSHLESELLAIEAELKTVDLGLERLESLAARSGRVVAWTSETARQEKQTLVGQIQNLEAQGRLLSQSLADETRQLERTRADMSAGLVTATEVQRATSALRQVEVQLHANELQLSKTRAALLETKRRGRALGTAPTSDAQPSAIPHMAPPEVAKSDDDRIRLEIEISRLHAEKRAAQARERSTRASIESMDALLRDLEARPLYRAMQYDTDIAFAPYSHLQKLRIGNSVYSCTWSLFLCRAVGKVAEIVPGEVVTQDPWGTLQRGQYVVLSMRDRESLRERVLRIRPGMKMDAGMDRVADQSSDRRAR